MLTKLNLNFPSIDCFTVPSARTLGVFACGSAAIAVWHRVDRRNDMEENKVRNTVIQTAFLSLSSMFGMLWAMSETNVPSLTKAVATLCAGATTTIPVDIMAARSFPFYQEEPVMKVTVSSPTSDTSVAMSPKILAEDVVVLADPPVDRT